MDCAGPLHVRPDEEPDVTQVSYAAAGRVCLQCGQSTHRTQQCPHRPNGPVA